MIHVLYKSTNLKNRKYYVGVHSTEDSNFGTEKWMDPYIGSGLLIWKALRKHGREYFKVEVLAYFPDRASAFSAERDYVTAEWLNENQKRVYNINVGGSQPPKNDVPPPTQKGTRWINNGKYNKRCHKDMELPEGWIEGRLFKFTDEEITKRRNRLRKRNIENNPMANTIIRSKMTETVKNQYRNGRKPHNYLEK